MEEKMNSEEKTLPDLPQISDSIKGLEQTINDLFQEIALKIENLRQEILPQCETDFSGKRLELRELTAENCRVKAVTHKTLSVALAFRADLRILREEVNSLAVDVRLKNNLGVLS